MNKKIIILSMYIAILIMIIGYSMFLSNIKINGTANITSTWNILFTDIKELSKTSGVIVKEEPKASGTLATFNVAFTKPGDKIVYEITVENKGSLNAIINKINATQLGSDVIEFVIDGIKEGDKLGHGESKNFTVTIKYKDVTKEPNLKDNELQIDITYIQDLKEQEQKEPDIVPTRLSQKILYDNEEQSDKDINFGAISSNTNGKGLYYTNKNTEDNRVTYYFRGDVKNNYVSFGGFYWRIVRINEDGSIRLIYQGKNPTDTGIDATIGTSSFNTMPGDNAFVGYMYGTPTIYQDGWNWDEVLFHSTTGTVKMSKTYSFDTNTGIYTLTGDIVDGYYTETYHGYYTCYSGEITCNHMIKIGTTKQEGNIYQLWGGDRHAGYWSTSYEKAHKNEVNSDIKIYLENWYKDNLLNYDDYISDTGFCNDRSIIDSSFYLGYGRKPTKYRSSTNLFYNTNKIPQFACPNPSHDLFTVSNEKGNKISKYKVGLITIDEVSYAGGLCSFSGLSKANNYFLNSNVKYWTMSPFYFDSTHSRVYDWAVSIDGSTYAYEVRNFLGVRPVINLNAKVEITDINQNGTINNPYIIKM